MTCFDYDKLGKFEKYRVDLLENIHTMNVRDLMNIEGDNVVLYAFLHKFNLHYYLIFYYHVLWIII